MKIEKLKKITDFKFLNMFVIDYRDMRGNKKTWHFASRHEEPRCITKDFSMPDAVVIVPFHTVKQQIVVIKEFRVPLADYQYGFPAGLVDQGESIIEAGARELKEETGLNLTKVLNQSPAVFSTSGMTDESVCMLYAECDGEADNAYNESSEDISVEYFTQVGASRFIKDPTLKFDVKTWLALYKFAESGWP